MIDIAHAGLAAPYRTPVHRRRLVPAAFFLSQFRERKSLQLVLELLVCWRNSASAKVVQLLLELDFCWRNSTSAKVYNFRWNCLFVGAIPRAQKSTTCPGIAFLLAQSRERKSRATFAGIACLLAQFRERKSRATFAGIACLLAQFRERKSRATFAGIACLLAQFRERKSRATFAGIAFLLAQFRERKSRATFAGIACLLAQFRERKSRATFAGIAWCADRMPVHRRRPAPGLSAAPVKPPGDSPAGANAKMRAKVVQLVLKLDFCWRNSASAKVYNFRWNCLVC